MKLGQVRKRAASLLGTKRARRVIPPAAYGLLRWMVGPGERHRSGQDLFLDMRVRLPQLHVDVAFDVGANVGQSARAMRAAFPEARIYCFEPAGSTFELLQENVSALRGVEAFRLALGARVDTGVLRIDGASTMYSLVRGREGSDGGPAAGGKHEHVRVESLDSFCAQHAIDHIGYLKIDTEGGDLDVLRGAERMLDEQRIGVVLVEAGLNPLNERHVPFEALKSHLQAKQYFLFGIYDQTEEWPTGSRFLRRANCAFIPRALGRRDGATTRNV